MFWHCRICTLLFYCLWNTYVDLMSSIDRIPLRFLRKEEKIYRNEMNPNISPDTKSSNTSMCDSFFPNVRIEKFQFHFSENKSPGIICSIISVSNWRHWNCEQLSFEYICILFIYKYFQPSMYRMNWWPFYRFNNIYVITDEIRIRYFSFTNMHACNPSSPVHINCCILFSCSVQRIYKYIIIIIIKHIVYYVFWHILFHIHTPG